MLGETERIKLKRFLSDEVVLRFFIGVLFVDKRLEIQQRNVFSFRN